VSEPTTHHAATTGISFGSAFALVLSWTKWHAFWWAILHGCLGWIYVIYYWFRFYRVHG
jgi:hypothetical protein